MQDTELIHSTEQYFFWEKGSSWRGFTEEMTPTREKENIPIRGEGEDEKLRYV